jgi:hypothetical protein
MKKVKVMLSGLVVVAVVSGALAFKAVKTTQRCIYTKSSAGQTALLTKTGIEGFVETSTGDFATILPLSGTTCPATTNVATRLSIDFED